MIDSVFISDLHLQSNCQEIHERFVRFVQWAKANTQNVYILGDFMHVWSGDDLIDDYAKSIIALLSELNDHGIKTYFLPGNRDFLVGKQFYTAAKIQPLNDCTIINLHGCRVFLTHGDRYCTADIAHQFLRLITRNFLFRLIFLNIPKFLRHSLVKIIREYSQSKKKSAKYFPINQKKLFKDMHKNQVSISIYGHIHKPNHFIDTYKNFTYQRFILSDWDNEPRLLCFNNQKGFFFAEMT